MARGTASVFNRRRLLRLEVWMFGASPCASCAWPLLSRRGALRSLALLAGLPAWCNARAAPYPVTIDAMHRARETETRVYYHYTEYGRRAQQDGYRGIAYLFTAFAASEQVHAANFGKILTRLNVELPPLAKPEIHAGTTRENLMRAADSEIASIEAFYPKLLEQLKPEGHEEATTLVRYAWGSEKQHLDKIRQIQRWTGAFFETVARSIDEKTGRYFICQNCGSTTNSVPANLCPVCKFPSSLYRGVEPPA
jgi:rubrerythrin